MMGRAQMGPPLKRLRNHEALARSVQSKVMMIPVRRDIRGLVVSAVLCVSALLFLLALPQMAHAGYYASGDWPVVQTLSEPTDLAFSMDGRVFVADSVGRRIVVCSSAGDFSAEFDGSDEPGQELVKPVAVVIGPDGRLYVADEVSDRISVFELDGTFVRSFGEPGSGPTQIDGPFDLTFAPSGELLVVDRWNNRVQVFTATGTHLRSLLAGHEPPLEGPSSIAARVSGTITEVYVTEATSRVVRVFNFATGTVLRTWGITLGGSTGATVSRYLNPSGIHATPDGRILVSDAGRNMVEGCTTIGSIETTYVGFNQPSGVVLSGGDVYVADRMYDRVAVVDVDATRTAAFFASRVSVAPAVTSPKVVASGTDGSTYVAEASMSRVRKYDAEGDLLFTFPQPTTGTPGTMSQPSGIAVLESWGQVWIADTGNHRLLAYTLEGDFVGVYGSYGTELGQFSSPRGLSVYPGEFLAWTGRTPPGECIAVADTGNKRILFVDPSLGLEGSLSNFIQNPVAIPSPYAVTFAADTGYLYVADTGRNRIVVFDIEGNYVRTIGTPGTANGFLMLPHDVKMVPGTNGDILVADTANSRIQRFTRGGSWVMTFGARGSGKGELYRPTSLAVRSAERIVIADTDNHRVVEAGYEGVSPVTIATGDVETWLSGVATVTLEATDDESGILKTYYQVRDPSGVTGPWLVYRGPITFTAEGISVISFYSIDRAGNGSASLADAARVMIDNTPPSGSVVFASGAATVAPGPIPVSMAVADALQMRLGTVSEPGTWTAYSANGTVTVSAEGPTVLKASFLDRASNLYEVSRGVIVDGTGPVTTIRGVPSSGLATNTVTLSLDAVDTYSAISSRRYRVDGGAERTYFAPFQVTGNTSHTVEAWSVDALGNRGETASETFRISQLSAGGSLVLAGGAATVGSASVQVTTTALGATHVAYRTDEMADFSDWQPATGAFPVTFSDEGTSTVWARYKDANDIVIEMSDDVIIDLSAPETVIKGIPARGGSQGPLLLSLQWTDTYSTATANYQLTRNGVSATPVAYSAPFVVGEVGEEATYTIDYWSVDHFGNTEARNTAQLVISSVAPTGTFTVDGSRGIFVRQPDVTLRHAVPTAVDMRFALDDGEFGDWVPYSATTAMACPGEGYTTIRAEYRSISEVLMDMERLVCVDMTPPRIAGVSLLPTGFTLGSDGVMRTDFRFSGLGSDPASLFGGPSGTSAWGWRAGRYVNRTPAADDVVASTDLVGVAPGYHRVSIALSDRVGNLAVRSGIVRTGVGTTPQTPTTVAANKRFIVSGSIPHLGTGASYRLHIYRRNASGHWEIYRTTACRTTLVGIWARLATAPVLPAGTYRAVFFGNVGLSRTLSQPSAVIRVQ